MDKKLIYAVLIVVVIAGIIAFSWKKRATPEVQPPTTAVPVVEQKTDTTGAINESLKGIDIGDINKEFKDIDKTINNL